MILVLLLPALAFAKTIPVNYEITIVPTLSDLAFKSDTIITVQVEEQIDKITLNAKNLKISDPINVSNSVGEEIKDVTFDLEQSSETLVIKFKNLIPADLYRVNIISSGTINTNLKGFYTSTYTVGTQIKKIFLTNFQYTNARQVFPCFDHPSFVSTFTLNLVHPKNLKSVATTVKISEIEVDEANIKEVFAQSDPMPPHLLAFALTDLSQVNYEEVVIFTKEVKEVNFLGQWSKTVLYNFQASEPFKIRKLNQIVVPDQALCEDVVINLGLIFYRSSSDINSSSK